MKYMTFPFAIILLFINKLFCQTIESFKIDAFSIENTFGFELGYYRIYNNMKIIILNGTSFELKTNYDGISDFKMYDFFENLKRLKNHLEYFEVYLKKLDLCKIILKPNSNKV